MNNVSETLTVDCEYINIIYGKAKSYETTKEYVKTNLVQSVWRLPPGQAEERWHLSGWGGRASGRDPVVGWKGGQGGLAHAQRHRHGAADVQRLVERQPAQAVGVEVVWGEEGLGTQQGWLQGWEGGFLSDSSVLTAAAADIQASIKNVDSMDKHQSHSRSESLHSSVGKQEMQLERGTHTLTLCCWNKQLPWKHALTQETLRSSGLMVSAQLQRLSCRFKTTWMEPLPSTWGMQHPWFPQNALALCNSSRYLYAGRDGRSIPGYVLCIVSPLHAYSLKMRWVANSTCRNVPTEMVFIVL